MAGNRVSVIDSDVRSAAPLPSTPSLDEAFAGLNALEQFEDAGRPRFARRAWRATWPKLLALALILLVWQAAVWVHWKPYILQSPATVARQLWELVGTALFWQACWVTAQQVVIGYVLVLVIGAVVGTAVAQIPVLRAAVGALITGMQTMPSVLWYPLAIMFFGVSSKAIIMMMILGAAPAVANGFISGIDQVPPSLLRVGRVLGARGLSLERHVVLPAAFPSVLGLCLARPHGWRVPHLGQSAQPGRTDGQRSYAGRVGCRRRHDDHHRGDRGGGRHGVLHGRPVGPPAVWTDRQLEDLSTTTASQTPRGSSSPAQETRGVIPRPAGSPRAGSTC